MPTAGLNVHEAIVLGRVFSGYPRKSCAQPLPEPKACEPDEQYRNSYTYLLLGFAEQVKLKLQGRQHVLLKLILSSRTLKVTQQEQTTTVNVYLDGCARRPRNLFDLCPWKKRRQEARAEVMAASCFPPPLQNLPLLRPTKHIASQLPSILSWGT